MELLGGGRAGGIPSPGLASLCWFRFHFQFRLLLSKPRRLRKSTAGGAVVRRNHWIICGQTPFGAIFIGRHPELRQMPLEALEPFSVVQTNQIVGSDALLGGNLGEGFLFRRYNGLGFCGSASIQDRERRFQKCGKLRNGNRIIRDIRANQVSSDFIVVRHRKLPSFDSTGEIWYDLCYGASVSIEHLRHYSANIMSRVSSATMLNAARSLFYPSKDHWKRLIVSVVVSQRQRAAPGKQNRFTTDSDYRDGLRRSERLTRAAVPRPHQVLKQAHWTFHVVD